MSAMPDLRFDASLISNRVAYTPSSNQQILLNHLAAPPTRMALALNSARAPHRYGAPSGLRALLWCVVGLNADNWSKLERFPL